jgi:hypothetical protein
MLPLMPKATAVWLVENTTLTFPQIADFCGLHELEIQAIADGEVAAGIVGADPIANGQLTREELARVQGDPDARLVMAKSDRPQPVARPKGPRYTPVAKRQDRPDAISWLVKNHPELADPQIAKLVGTTKSTIAAVRERTHWNSQNIKQRDPVTLGLCTMADLNNAVDKANRRLAKAGGSATAKAKAAQAKASVVPVDPGSADQPDVPVE